MEHMGGGDNVTQAKDPSNLAYMLSTNQWILQLDLPINAPPS